MLRRIRAVFHKEFSSYWNSPVGYIFLALFLIISQSLFFLAQEFFVTNVATMRSYFAVLPTMFLFFIPAVTMRLWAEER
ncbi:MAG TPA: ABC transporter, partial [bacterium]|nr:ABC transporter [bacterium]